MFKIFPKIKYLDTSDFVVTDITLKDNVKINYAFIGKGPIVIMIHGMANNWISLIPIARLLKDKYRIILVDLPGYGDSSKLSEHTVDTLSYYLIEFVKQLDSKPLSLIGFSMSGIVVAEAIRKNQSITKSAIILGPYISFINKERLSIFAHKLYYLTAKKKAFDTPVKKMLELRISGYLAGRLLNMHRYNSEMIDTLSIIGRRKLKPGVYSQIGYSVMNYRLEKALKDIKIPLLLVIGEYDKIISPHQLNRVVSQSNKDVKIKVVKDAGHALNMDAINECSQIISEFIFDK